MPYNYCVGTLLFEWAKQHGAKISSSIQVQQSSSGGRGLYATQDIPANTELITIPYHLQLGVRQLAMGSDIEMQEPWPNHCRGNT